jgi:hypothetical protein
MANPNNPHGLRPLGTSITGGAVAVSKFSKAVGDTQAIYRQDVLARAAGGAVSSAGLTPGTTFIQGVSLDFGAASKATDHLVITDPGALFECQSDLSATGGTVSVVAANMGLNANLTAWAAGSTLPPNLSITQISATSAATTSTLDVHLLGLYADIQNAFGNYCRIEIFINKHRFNGVTAGV